jgi:hypothetical protein
VNNRLTTEGENHFYSALLRHLNSPSATYQTPQILAVTMISVCRRDFSFLLHMDRSSLGVCISSPCGTCYEFQKIGSVIEKEDGNVPWTLLTMPFLGDADSRVREPATGMEMVFELWKYGGDKITVLLSSTPKKAVEAYEVLLKLASTKSI